MVQGPKQVLGLDAETWCNADLVQPQSAIEISCLLRTVTCGAAAELESLELQLFTEQWSHLFEGRLTMQGIMLVRAGY